MRGAILYGPRDLRFAERADPAILVAEGYRAMDERRAIQCCTREALCASWELIDAELDGARLVRSGQRAD
jgi:hypothetical protein